MFVRHELNNIFRFVVDTRRSVSKLRRCFKITIPGTRGRNTIYDRYSKKFDLRFSVDPAKSLAVFIITDILRVADNMYTVPF